MRPAKGDPELASVPMGKGELIHWKGKDGMPIEGIVVYPVGYERGKRYPTVAIIHGGPSGVWNEAISERMGRPCWMAWTRRAAKLRPSRTRSTS